MNADELHPVEAMLSVKRAADLADPKKQAGLTAPRELRAYAGQQGPTIPATAIVAA
jgi:hypothetical protein